IARGILARNPPYAARLDIVNPVFQTGTSLADGLPPSKPSALLDAASLNAAHGAIYAIEPQNYTPYADQWSVSFERRFPRRMTVELALLSSMGIHLLTEYDINQPYPGPTPSAYRRYPFEPYTSRVEYLSFSAGSTYYGGQMKFTAHPIASLRL